MTLTTALLMLVGIVGFFCLLFVIVAVTSGWYLGMSWNTEKALNNLAPIGDLMEQAQNFLPNLGRKHPDGVYALMALATEDAIMKERALSSNHPDVAESLDILACLHAGLTYDSTLAYELFMWALKIRKKSLGSEHPLVATSLDNLAKMFDRYTDEFGPNPESLYRQALEIRHEALGPEHFEVVRSLENLALHRSGNSSDCLPGTLHYFEWALEIRERTLGPEHTLVASALYNMGKYHCYHDRHSEAEPLFKRALAIREKAQGLEHPDVAISLTDLANCYVYQERFTEAEPLLRRSIEILEKALGIEHIEYDQPVEMLEQDLHKFKRKCLIEKLDLIIEKGPEEFAEGTEVRFERISVTEKQITLLTLVTRPVENSIHEKAWEGATLKREAITPREVLERPNLVPQKYGYTTWTKLGEALQCYGCLLSKTGREGKGEKLLDFFWL